MARTALTNVCRSEGLMDSACIIIATCRNPSSLPLGGSLLSGSSMAFTFASNFAVSENTGIFESAGGGKVNGASVRA